MTNKIMSAKTVGILMVVVSAVGYGLQPILGKLAYSEGVTPSALTFGRFVAAALFFEIHYLFLPRGEHVKRRELLTAAGIGCVFAGAAFCYFISLQYLTPVVFSFLYYTYPAMTLLVGFIFFGEKVSGRFMAGAGVVLLGTPFLLGGGEASADIAGVLWILGCSLCMAFFFRLQKFLPNRRCELYHAKIMARTMALVFMMWWIIDGMPSEVGGWGLLWVFLIGLISTYIALTAAIIGVSKLGANRAALLSGQEPLWTTLFALMVLGASPAPAQWFGAAIMLAAIFYINSADNKMPIKYDN